MTMTNNRNVGGVDAPTNSKESNFIRYMKTYSYKELTQKYSLAEWGVWKVLGEDPNPDFGGPHIMPELGFFEGTLKDVILKAVDLPGFWQWGTGGDIRKVTIEPIKIEYV